MWISRIYMNRFLATEDVVLHTLILENYICMRQYMKLDLIRTQTKRLNTSKKDLSIKSFMTPSDAQVIINTHHRL